MPASFEVTIIKLRALLILLVKNLFSSHTSSPRYSIYNKISIMFLGSQLIVCHSLTHPSLSYRIFREVVLLEASCPLLCSPS